MNYVRFAVSSLIAAVLSGTASAAPPRTISFSGYEWAVNDSGVHQMGPGPNWYASDAQTVYVDQNGKLHLYLHKDHEKWVCAEVYLTKPLGFGTYAIALDTPVHDLDPNVVVGLFTYARPDAQAHREIDIEFSKWGNPANQLTGQYVLQPSAVPGNLHRFAGPDKAGPTVHVFNWAPNHLKFYSESPSGRYAEAELTGPFPSSLDETFRINLWLFRGVYPTAPDTVEVVVGKFTFTPSP